MQSGTVSTRERGKIAHPAGNSHGRTVLVVDDEWLVRWSLSEGFSEAGYTVKVAQDAREALESFRSDPADAVLLDVRLPDSSDLGLLKRLKQIAPACPILLMTAYRTAELFEQAREAGAFRIVDKPFDIEVIIGLVAEALSGASPNGAPA